MASSRSGTGRSQSYDLLASQLGRNPGELPLHVVLELIDGGEEQAESGLAPVHQAFYDHGAPADSDTDTGLRCACGKEVVYAADEKRWVHVGEPE